MKSSVLSYTRQAQSKSAGVSKQLFSNTIKTKSAGINKSPTPITKTLTLSADLLRYCLHSVPCSVQYSTQPALSSRGGHTSPPFLGSWMTCLLRTRYVVLQGSAQPLQTLHWDTTQGITGRRVRNRSVKHYRNEASNAPSPEKTLIDTALYNLPFFTIVPKLCQALPSSSVPRSYLARSSSQPTQSKLHGATHLPLAMLLQASNANWHLHWMNCHTENDNQPWSMDHCMAGWSWWQSSRSEIQYNSFQLVHVGTNFKTFIHDFKFWESLVSNASKTFMSLSIPTCSHTVSLVPKSKASAYKQLQKRLPLAFNIPFIHSKTHRYHSLCHISPFVISSPWACP